MRNLLLIIFICFSVNFFGQLQILEDNSITMTLGSVIEINQSSQYMIKVANTEKMIINYCDKYIAVPAGVHLISVDINQYCHLVIVESSQLDLESEAEETKVISSGMKTINYSSNQVINTEDYIEYTICDTLIDQYNRQ